MSFADNLRATRIKKRFSQAELAELVGITQVAIARFESGVILPNVITGDKIAALLDTTVEQLVHGVREEQGERNEQ